MHVFNLIRIYFHTFLFLQPALKKGLTLQSAISEMVSHHAEGKSLRASRRVRAADVCEQRAGQVGISRELKVLNAAPQCHEPHWGLEAMARRQLGDVSGVG